MHLLPCNAMQTRPMSSYSGNVMHLLPCNAMQPRPMSSYSVCVSVMFVHSVKTNTRIFKIFSPSGIEAILFFRYQMAWHYSDGNPLTGASNAGGVGRNRNYERIRGAFCEDALYKLTFTFTYVVSLHAVNAAMAQVLPAQAARPRSHKL